MTATPSLDRFHGCLLGLAAGDALGAPFEGIPADTIYWGFGTGGDLLDLSKRPVLRYTDDTQMMIGVAECLADHGRIVEEALVRRFADNFDPRRGYGAGARRVLEAMVAGGDWRDLALHQFPGGSLGNGAAMRVAPVGLVFANDLDRAAEEARLSALPTHVHPLGIEGAQTLAVAVALAARSDTLDRPTFYHELLARAQSEEFRWALSTAARLRPTDGLSVLGSGLEAHRSVVTAIACFTASPGDFRTTITRAIALGDDTDTVAAMAGALVGAHAGRTAIPGEFIDRLEDGPKGRTCLTHLAERLHAGHAGQA